MPKEFTNFGEWGKYYGAKSQDEKEKELAQRFEKVLKGKFDYFPAGNFKSTLEGIDSVSIVRPRPSQKTGKVEVLNVVVFYKLGKKETHETLTLGPDGTITGQLPRALGIKNQDVLEDVLHTAETIDLDFFEFVSGEILPAPVREPGRTGSGGVGGGEGEPTPTDPKRLAFMRNQPKVLFGITDTTRGFGGYYGFVFPDRIILENEKLKNAVYIFGLENPVDVPRGRFRLPPAKRLRKDERARFIEGEWGKIAGLTKVEARERGATRIIHPGMEDEEWQKKMQAAIDRKLEIGN